MKVITTYTTAKGKITVETEHNTRPPALWNNPNGVPGEWLTFEGGEWVPDKTANNVKIKGPYPAGVLLEIIAWEQAGQPDESKPRVLRCGTVDWTEIS